MTQGELPKAIEKYGETPLFNEETVPKKLTSEHSTKPGVWGKICVSSGELLYVIPGDPTFEQCLTPGVAGIVAPEQVHFVTPKGAAEFKVEFYRKPL